MIALPIQIVILAGGLGTRLRPVTNQIPKAMVLIHGKPFIHYQLEWLARNEVHDVILSTGYLGHQIQDFVQDGRSWGLRVQYIDEGKNLLGTGGALRLVSDHPNLQDKFLVTYGDSYLPIPFKKIWQAFLEQTEPALMTVLKNHEKWDTSNACFQEGKITLYDKKASHPKPPQMQYIDYGLSAWTKECIKSEFLLGQKADMADLFNKLSLEGRLAGFEVTQRFYEVGSLEGIRDLSTFFDRV